MDEEDTIGDYPRVVLKEPRSGPVRSRFFMLIKRLLIGAICLSTLAINFALLIDLLDYLNLNNLQSMASGIVVGASLITIIFNLIGLFAVIKEDAKFSFIFVILLAIGTLIGSLVTFVAFEERFDGLFVPVVVSNLIVIAIGMFFSILIKCVTPISSNSVSPAISS